MSEPMGCSDHLAYCTDSAIPLLETVSEEARRHTGIIIDNYFYKLIRRFIKMNNRIF